jgi:hypothetical protein
MLNEDIIFYLIQILGMIATVFYLYSDIQEDDKELDKLYTIGNVFFLMHLLLLKSYVPSITVFLAILRNTLNNKYPDNKLIKYSFTSVFIVILFSALIFMDQWQNALPAVVSLIMTFAFLYTKGNMLTALMVLCSVLWFIVGISIDSMPIMILEVVSILLLLYRAYKQNKSKEKEIINN